LLSKLLDILVIVANRLSLLIILETGVVNEALSADRAYAESAGVPQFKIMIYNTITASKNKILALA